MDVEVFGVDVGLILLILFVPLVFVGGYIGSRQDRRIERDRVQRAAEERRRWEALEAENRRLRDALAGRGQYAEPGAAADTAAR